MNSATWQRLTKSYLQDLVEVAALHLKGRLLYRTPGTEGLLQGVAAEPSAFSKDAFVVQVFTQPLFVPAANVSFSFGGRLGTLARGGEHWWRLSKADESLIMDEVRSLLRSEGLPFLDRTATTRGFASYLDKSALPAGNLRAAEAYAYSLAFVGDSDSAKVALSGLVGMAGDAMTGWKKELVDRAALLLSKLNAAPEEAVAQLKRWSEESMRNLGISSAAA